MLNVQTFPSSFPLIRFERFPSNWFQPLLFEKYFSLKKTIICLLFLKKSSPFGVLTQLGRRELTWSAT